MTPLLLSLLSASLFVATVSQAAPVTNAPLARLPRTNLLAYYKGTKLITGKTPADWHQRRKAILRGMTAIMGPFPTPKEPLPLEMKVEEEVDAGTYIQQRITYVSDKDSRVPAYLLIPKKAIEKGEKCPAILSLHSTDNVNGAKAVLGISGKPNRNNAQELAQRGYVVLAPYYPLMAEYQPDLKKLGYTSGTMKAIWDNHCGVDLLLSLRYVEGQTVGAIGHSLGGHNALFTAVFEPRIKVVVASSSFDSFLDYKGGDITGWTQERYMPALKNYAHSLDKIPFDFQEVIAALAPRTCFVNAPLRDDNFSARSVDKVLADARPIYRLFDAESHLTVVHPDTEHDFPPEAREQAYKILDEQLK